METRYRVSLHRTKCVLVQINDGKIVRREVFVSDDIQRTAMMAVWKCKLAGFHVEVGP